MIVDTSPTHFESLYPAQSRKREIEQIIGFVKSGNSCQIIGLPGVGRSNTLELLSYNHNVRTLHLADNQKWFHFVLFNCKEIKNKSLLDALKFIFLSTADSLRDRGLKEEHDKLHEIFNQHSSLNDQLVLFQGLKEALDYLCLEKEFTIVFMFDRFEEYIPSLTAEFFSNLRVLRDRAKYRFSAVFSIQRPLEDLVDQNILIDYYEFLRGNAVYISLFDKPSLDFRLAYLQKTTGKMVDKKIIDDIYTLTGGHGKLSRIAAEEVLNNSSLRASETSAAISGIASATPRNDKLEQFLLNQKSIQHTLLEIWTCLTPAEQNLLSSVIARSEITKQSQERDRHAKFIPPLAGLAMTSDSFLEKTEFIKNTSVTIPLFASFVKNNPLIQQSSNEIIQYDEKTNTIKKGNQLLSENLTASEFKLLKYLISNPEKVLEREEIIQSVWRDTKSTAGVTDQAIDQLVFRLRKKIENNPNAPQHIQTVKGRGLKFTP